MAPFGKGLTRSTVEIEAGRNGLELCTDESETRVVAPGQARVTRA